MFTESAASAGPIGTSRRGRRRRMLALQFATDVTAPVENTVEQADDSEPRSTTSVAASDSQKSAIGTSAGATTLAHDGDRILELLDDVQPRTWVFTGDNLSFQIEQARRGWIEHFSDFIHERISREQDVILNTSFANSTIDHLLNDVDARIFRFQPEVVLIMPSPAECAQRGEAAEFRETLRQLTERLHEEGCTVVLNTPPCPASASASPSTIKSMKTAASRIRAVAQETGAVLADHFSHWQATIERDGSKANLHTESGNDPSARGHRELARRLLKSLDIRTP